MPQLNELLMLLSYITVLSVTVERLVEMFKPGIDITVQRFELSDRVRKTLIYVTAFAGGASVHAMSGMTIPFFADPIAARIVAGLLVSGGSGVWHDLLSILSDYKTNISATK